MALLSPTAKFTPLFDTVPEIFEGRVIGWDVWPPYTPDLTPCGFYFWVRLKDKVCKTNIHTLEELKIDTRLEVSTIFGEDPRE
jgi:hypothetical protein